MSSISKLQHGPKRRKYTRLTQGLKYTVVQDRSFRAPNGWDPNALPINTVNARPAPNMGIYTRVYAAEIKCKRNYKSTSRLINTCLGLQIVVAAALTALGAAGKSGSAVTVFGEFHRSFSFSAAIMEDEEKGQQRIWTRLESFFFFLFADQSPPFYNPTGAINTIIAGFLTYLKGSGLPNRIKYYQHEWAKVREYIEQRERDLACGRMFDVMAEVETIRQMYESVKADIEFSQPDRFVGANNLRNQMGNNGSNSAAGGPTHQQPMMMNAKSFSDASSDANHLIAMPATAARGFKSGVEARTRDLGDLEKGLEAFGKGWFHEKQTEANTALNRAQHGVTDAATGHLTGLKARLEEKIRDIGHLEKELETRGRGVVEEKKGALVEGVRQAETLGHEIEANARATLAEAEHATRDTVATHQAAANAAINERSDAARAAVLESRLAAEASVRNAQNAANSVANEAARAAAETGAAARAGAHDVIDHAFDAPSAQRHDAPR